MSCDVCAGYSSYNCPCCGGEDVIECPMCQGTGEGDYMVFDIIDRMVIKTDKTTYELSAEDENTAGALQQRFCKYSNVCQSCQGEGMIKC